MFIRIPSRKYNGKFSIQYVVDFKMLWHCHKSMFCPKKKKRLLLPYKHNKTGVSKSFWK